MLRIQMDRGSRALSVRINSFGAFDVGGDSDKDALLVSEKSHEHRFQISIQMRRCEIYQIQTGSVSSRKVQFHSPCNGAKASGRSGTTTANNRTLTRGG